MPYVVVSSAAMACHFGPDKHTKDKDIFKKAVSKTLEADFPPAKKRRKLLQSTKKKNCPARILMKEVIKFPEYAVSFNRKYDRRKQSQLLRDQLMSTGTEGVTMERRFYLTFPSTESHANTHIHGELAGMMLPVSNQVKERIEFLVASGIQSVGEMKRALDVYVKSVLFEDKAPPALMNRAYYPLDSDIRYHMYKAQMAHRYSKIDQENLMCKIEDWKTSSPGDKFHFTPSAKADCTDTIRQAVDAICAEDEDVDVYPQVQQPVDTSFCFVHQTHWQQYLLARYGNDISLLDATYKTTRYALPLFFLAVKTNVGFSVVAEFIQETETQNAIAKALFILKEWNPRWKPKFFMTDFSETEIHAIEEVFQDCRVLLCDFHREQCWERWTKKGSNISADDQMQVLSLLRRIAHAATEEEYENAVGRLKHSAIWAKYPKLQNWFLKTWLPESKRWVWAFRRNRGLLVNTNNGLERQNKVFKYSYLTKLNNFSVSGMIDVLINTYLPEQLRNYVRKNATALESVGKTYDSRIPDYLRSRPPYFVRHCQEKMSLAEEISSSDIVQGNALNFKVKQYSVCLNTGDGLPQCDCPSWRWEHLPCKHMFAILRLIPGKSWDCLPKNFTTSPYFTLDTEILGQYNGNHVQDSDIIPSTASTTASLETPQFEPLPPRRKLENEKQLARACRERLGQLREATFLCTSASDLRHMLGLLDEIQSFIDPKIKTDGGLKVENNIKEDTKKWKRKRKTKTLYKKLSRRKKQMCRRVGLSARKKHAVKIPTEDACITHKADDANLIIDGHADVPITGEPIPSPQPVPCKSNTATSPSKKQEHWSFCPKDRLNPPVQQALPLAHLDSDVLSRLSEMTHPDGPVLIGDFTLSAQDFQCLSDGQYLNDKIIESYLRLIAEEIGQNVACILTPFLPCKWAGGDFTSWKFSKIKMSSYQWILVPICVDSHWCLLAANVRNQTVSLLDSLPNVRRDEIYINFWRKYMMERTSSAKVSPSDIILKDGWEHVFMECSRQKDSFNCGVFLLMNAEALLRKKDLSCVSVELNHARLYRKYISYRLIEAADRA